jgi:hypothetical protein
LLSLKHVGSHLGCCSIDDVRPGVLPIPVYSNGTVQVKKGLMWEKPESPGLTGLALLVTMSRVSISLLKKELHK